VRTTTEDFVRAVTVIVPAASKMARRTAARARLPTLRKSLMDVPDVFICLPPSGDTASLLEYRWGMRFGDRPKGYFCSPEHLRSVVP